MEEGLLVRPMCAMDQQSQLDWLTLNQPATELELINE